MRLLTIQHKNVLKLLSDGKVFYADIRYVPENRIVPYQHMMTAYHWNNCPIFAGAVGKYSEFTGIRKNDAVIMELEVLKEEVRFQRYYDWSDIIYFLECPREWEGRMTIEEFEHMVFTETRFDENDAIQATINRIEPEWMVGYMDHVTEKFIRLHYNSGGRNILGNITEYQDKSRKEAGYE